MAVPIGVAVMSPLGISLKSVDCMKYMFTISTLADTLDMLTVMGLSSSSQMVNKLV